MHLQINLQMKRALTLVKLFDFTIYKFHANYLILHMKFYALICIYQIILHDQPRIALSFEFEFNRCRELIKKIIKLFTW